MNENAQKQVDGKEMEIRRFLFDSLYIFEPFTLDERDEMILRMNDNIKNHYYRFTQASIRILEEFKERKSFKDILEDKDFDSVQLLKVSNDLLNEISLFRDRVMPPERISLNTFENPLYCVFFRILSKSGFFKHPNLKSLYDSFYFPYTGGGSPENSLNATFSKKKDLLEGIVNEVSLKFNADYLKEQIEKNERKNQI